MTDPVFRALAEHIEALDPELKTEFTPTGSYLRVDPREPTDLFYGDQLSSLLGEFAHPDDPMVIIFEGQRFIIDETVAGVVYIRRP